MAEPVIIPALAGAAPDAPETLKSTNIADTIMVGARVRTHHPGAAASRRGVARRERQRRAPAVGEVDGGEPDGAAGRSSTGRSWCSARSRTARSRSSRSTAGRSQLPGNTAEATFVTMHQRARTRPVWPGPRGDSLMSGAATSIGLPFLPGISDPDGTSWSTIFADGWLVHIFPDGEMPRARRPPGRGRRAPRLPRRGQGVARRLRQGVGADQRPHAEPAGRGRVLRHRCVDAADRASAARGARPARHGADLRREAGPFPMCIESDGVDTVYVGDLTTGQIMRFLAVGSRRRPVARGDRARRLSPRCAARPPARSWRWSSAAASGCSRSRWTAACARSGASRRARATPTRRYYRQHDVDRLGTCGPVDDCFVSVWTSTGSSLWRLRFDGQPLSGRVHAQLAAPSSQGGRQRQGSIQWVGDPIGHYPGWVALSRTHAEMLVSAGAPAGVFLLRPTRAGEPQGWTSAQSRRPRRPGARSGTQGTTPGGPLRPEFWPSRRATRAGRPPARVRTSRS